MNAEMVVFDADFFTLLKGSADPGGLPMPFAREILLLETYVAGTTHVDDIEEIDRELSVLDLLIMRREPLNPYDERAHSSRNGETGCLSV
ncbi:MAG: hypothetical protein AB2L14_03555 [Candidatus Xenobiia bacterium LiM19]